MKNYFFLASMLFCNFIFTQSITPNQIVPQIKMIGYSRYIDISSKSRLLAIASENQVQVIDLNSNKIIYDLLGPDIKSMRCITGIQFDCDNKLYIRTNAFYFLPDGSKQMLQLPIISPFDCSNGAYQAFVFQPNYSFDENKCWRNIEMLPRWVTQNLILGNNEIYATGDTSVMLYRNQEFKDKYINLEIERCDFFKIIAEKNLILAADYEHGDIVFLNLKRYTIEKKFHFDTPKYDNNSDCLMLNGLMGVKQCVLPIRGINYDKHTNSVVVFSALKTMNNIDLDSWKLESMEFPNVFSISNLIYDSNNSKDYAIVKIKSNELAFPEEYIGEVNLKDNSAKIVNNFSEPVTIDRAFFSDDNQSLIIGANDMVVMYNKQTLNRTSFFPITIEDKNITEYQLLSEKTILAKKHSLLNIPNAKQEMQLSKLNSYGYYQSLNLKDIASDSIIGISPDGSFAFVRSGLKTTIFDLHKREKIKELNQIPLYNAINANRNQTFISDNGEWVMMLDTQKKQKVLLNTLDMHEKLVLKDDKFALYPSYFKFIDSTKLIVTQLNSIRDTLIFWNNQQLRMPIYNYQVNNIDLRDHKASIHNSYAFDAHSVLSSFTLNAVKSKIAFLFENSTLWNENAMILIRNLNNDSLVYWNTKIRNGATDLSVSRDGVLLMLQYSRNIEILNLNFGELTASILPTLNGNEIDAFFFDNQMHYMGKGNVNSLAFRIKDKAYPINQFDLQFNRPDLVLKSFIGDEKTIADYSSAYKLRTKNEKLNTTNYLSIPKVNILNKDEFSSTKDRYIKLKIKAIDELRSIQKMNLYINDVLYEEFNSDTQEGYYEINKIDANQKDVEIVTTVKLGDGLNTIKIVAENEDGIKSLPDIFSVTYTPNKPKTPRVYFIGFAIANYKDSSQNLSYTVADVINLADTIKKFYPDAYIKLFLDDSATIYKLNMLNLKPQPDVDDIVILSFSGHGYIDQDKEFNFLSPDCSLKNNYLCLENIRYTDIAHILRNIKSRKKLLLIDACNSGLLDTSQILQPSTGNEKNVFAQSKGATYVNNTGSNTSNIFDLTNELFYDFSVQDGTSVITATKGKEVAYESAKWHGGAFTYAIINAISSLHADANFDNALSVNELVNYVKRKVPEITHGMQTPSCRAVNIINDWILIKK